MVGHYATAQLFQEAQLEPGTHHFQDLFAQLGLANDATSIRQFLAAHAPIGGDVNIADASFWSPAQAAFLREALLDDSDWAELVDQLSEALRAP